MGAYAGPTGAPFAGGGRERERERERERGISKAGYRRLRAAPVERAWLWLRYQPASQLAEWFRSRTGTAGRRLRKVMIVAPARKPLVALWRFCRDGMVPAGALVKAAWGRGRPAASSGRPLPE